MNEQKPNYMAIIFAVIIFVLIGYLIGKTVYNEKNQSVQVSDQKSVDQSAEVTKENCVADECLKVENLEYPVSDLPQNVIEALDKAVDDEYKAHATYDKVIEVLGNIRPFQMIIRAEEQHIASLKALYDKYGVKVPEDSWLGSDEVVYYQTKEENCQLGVDAEIANYKLYEDELIPIAEGYDDIITVFTQLKDASKNNHLPAFEKCN